MDSTSIYPKSRSVLCFVGLVSNYSNSPNGLIAGGSVNCQGQCASLNGIVNGFNVTTYQCLDSSICKYALNGAASGCNALPGDRQINGCCCSDSDFCNIKGTNIPKPSVSNFTEPPIACYNGLWIDNSSVTAGRYLTCNGQCASVAITTSFQGALHTATVYTCDPSFVCRQMNMTNSCYVPETGVKGCCCNSDACIDPSKNRSPDINLNCYVGVYNGATGKAIGDSVLCNGGKKCLSLSTTMNGNLYKVYQCVNPAICNGMRPPLDNACSNNTAWDTDVSACCCDNGNLCNVGTESVGPNPPQLNYTGNPIACWSGLYLNGKSISGGSWSSCNGDCASIQLNTSLSSQTNSLTLYTCDPVTVCQQLGIVNTCGNLDQVPGLTGCCCSSDACMDSSSIQPKNRIMNCYAGIVSNFSSNPNNLMAGGPVKCNGRCASLTSTVRGNGQTYSFTAYQCIATSICQTLGIDGTSGSIFYDRDISGSCCSNGDFCSTAGTSINATASNFTEPAIACYSGLWVNGSAVADGGYIGCQGKCSSITISTTLSGQNQSATLYTCDPASVCSQLNITNSCGSPEPGITGCCCDSDACIDPNYNRYPGRQLTCYVGVYNGATGQSMGADTNCDGKCASVQTKVQGKRYKAYFCLGPKQTEALGVDNGCVSLPADPEIKACVCDGSNNCNVGSDEPVLQNPINTTYNGAPIACWNGVYVNNQSLGSVGWNGCMGQCASVQWQTTYMNNNHTLTLYTCDPAAACLALGLSNSCGNLDAVPGLTGCCCDSDACMDSTSIYPKSRSVLCYVGVTASNYISPANPAGVIAPGDSVACTGQCSWLSGNVGGQNVTSYQCVDRSICKYALNGAASGCGALNGDRQINGCCCSDSDFCSIKTTQIPLPDPKNFTEPPLACYGGLWIDNALVAGGGYSACFGKCASVTLNTTYAGQSHSATIYTCDPAAVCAGLNVTNQCTTLPNETGVSGCCCDSDACIDPNFGRYPGRSLSCYVGVYNQANNSSMGISTSCIGGKCGSIETNINNWKYKAYFCLNPQQTETLGVDHGCRNVVTDREISACVCDDSNNCNVKPGEYIAPNAPNVTIPGGGVTPIACWSGLYVNGTALGNDGWSGCLGNCAVIQFNTTAAPSGQAPQNHILTLYTCDPAAACGALGINNACVQNVDAIPGMTGCCCNFDGCVTKSSIYPIANPAATTKPSGSTTAVSTMFAMILTAVYTVLRHT